MRLETIYYSNLLQRYYWHRTYKMEEIELDGDAPINEETYRSLLGRLAQIERFHLLFEAERLTCAWDSGGEAKCTVVPKEAVLGSTVDGLFELLETEAAIVNVAG